MKWKSMKTITNKSWVRVIMNKSIKFVFVLITMCIIDSIIIFAYGAVMKLNIIDNQFITLNVLILFTANALISFFVWTGLDD